MRVDSLRSFLREIERVGELRRVRVPVSPHLEITEIVQRIVGGEGPAVLFESVEGSDFPLAINLFGSRRRIEIALGRPPAEIGESLFISPKTASAHVSNIKGKLGAGSRAEIVAIALRGGSASADR